MREAMSAVVESPQIGVPDLQITGITFEENNPCRPLYPSFYKGLPYAGLEPAFQVDPGISELSVHVSLAEGSEVVLVDDPQHPGKPLCRVLNAPEYLPKIVYEGEDQKSCTLTWEGSAGMPPSPLTRVFRIYCKPKTGEHTDEQKVYGGLLLAFTTHEVGKMGNPIPPVSAPGDPWNIYLIGADEAHRPLYELHQGPHPANPKIEHEVAYRIRQKKELLFHMHLAIPKAVWSPEPKFLQPPTKPEELQYELTDPKIFKFRWQDNGNEEPAKVTTFHAVPQLAPGTEVEDLPRGWTVAEYAEALADIGVDPTIIQPPKCDPVYGVCAPDGDYAPRTGAR